MSGADDYEHALGGLRGHIVYGEQTAGDTPVAWVQVKVALPYLRNAERVLVAERARASAAEAECARLTTELDAARRAATFAEMERDTLRGLTDAMRADNVRLRAIVEGRTVAPSDAEITAHHDAGGSGWLVSSDRDVIPYTLCRSEARDGGASPGARWWALDASGRPCPWPTPALDAAGEGR